MKILALETSAKSVSAAVTENGTVLASAYQNRGLTHSVTLMPLVDGMLHAAGLTLDDMGLIAVANGPGSFTGLRIGVSAAKGLAWAKELPCCGVSTLAAMARTSADHHGLVIGAMDARRQQIYHALFRAEDGRVTRLTEDCAISLEELASQLRNDPADKLVVGDGAALCAGYLNDAGIPCRMADQSGGAGASGPRSEDHAGLSAYPHTHCSLSSYSMQNFTYTEETKCTARKFIS